MLWDKKPRPVMPGNSNLAVVPPSPFRPDKVGIEPAKREPAPRPAGRSQTLLGRSVVLQGDVVASEDFLIEGEFQGNISLQDHCLTVGPQGRVKAEIRARQVVIHGTVEGNISARDTIEIHQTGRVVGDLLTAAIAIEEGAYFKGSIDILREGSQEPAPASTVAAEAGADASQGREEIGAASATEGPIASS